VEIALHETAHEEAAPPPSPFGDRFTLHYPLLSLRIDELAMEYQTFFTTAEAARVLRVSPRSVQRYAEHGDLKVTAIGYLRFHAEELERLLREGLPVRGRKANHIKMRRDSSGTSSAGRHGAI
jgi:hypothetical protein